MKLKQEFKVKKVLFLNLFFITTINFNIAQTGWQWQHPYPQGNELKAIQMNGSVGWAVGVLGTVMKTTNEGYDWELVDAGTTEMLNGVYVGVYNDVWIVGDNGVILYSSDQGSTWTDYSSITSENLNSVSGLLNACLWICGDNDVVLKTTDEGVNWEVFHPGYFLDLNAIDHFDCNNAWAVGDQGLLINTTDGGNNWTTHNASTSYDLYSIDLVEFGYYRVCGQGGVIVHSTDDGTTWQIEHQHPVDVLFNVDTKGIEAYAYAVGTQGTILETTDYGVSWAPRTVDYNPNFNDITWQALFHNIYVAGYYGVIYRNSGVGTDFELLDGGTRHWIQSIYFHDSNNGWAVGGDLFFGTNKGVILRTTDGGLNWDEVEENVLLNDVDFANGSEGWAVGKNGVIRRTTNAGQSWSTQTSSTTNDLNSLCFINEDFGWVVGDYGKIIHTTNGGYTWTGQANTAAGNLWGVCFIDESDGWVVGDVATILHTTDGGQNWSVQDANPSQNFRFTSVQFLDENFGWISAIYGRIFLTTDGGENWQQIEIPDLESLMSVFFIDRNNGWAVGENGTIAKSTDGGFTWEYQFSGVEANTLTSVFFLDNATGWVAGEGGTIIFTEDGGGDISFNTFFQHDRNLPIPDPGEVTDIIDVYVSPKVKSDFTLTGVTVFIDSVIHPEVSDLVFLLSHSNITDTLIIQNEISGNNIISCTLTDAASLSLAEGVSPYQGSYKPRIPLTVFSGVDPDGQWTLTVKDMVSGNSGILQAWGLKLFFDISTGLTSDYPIVPGEYKLYQNYPNPFNPGTTIQWQMPKSCFVTLKIYDVLGREVITLINKELDAGKYEICFDASPYSSGVYFYQIDTGSFLQARKMILLK